MGEVLHSRWSHMRIAMSRLLIKAARKLDPQPRVNIVAVGLDLDQRRAIEDWHGKAARQDI